MNEILKNADVTWATRAEQPGLRVEMPSGTPYRKVMAALHLLAARVEFEAPEELGFGVEIEAADGAAVGWVWAELVDNCEGPFAELAFVKAVRGS